MTFFHFLLVAVGGALGAIARYAMSKALNQSFPFGTLTVNLIGSFLLGVIVGSQANSFISLLLGSGFMGAFTTFSTLHLEITQLQEKGRVVLYIILTYGIGILLAYLGNLVGANVV